jgi:arginyl-tRNA synthetase
MNIRAELRRRFASALREITAEVTGDFDAASLADMVLPSQDAKHGDYQANCAMPLGKKLGKPPREIAAALVEQLNLNVDGIELCEPPTIAGPGFINLKLTNEALASLLQQAGSDEARLGVPPVPHPRTYVLDYSAPNVAKPMHVGHVRSTVIGAALDKTLRFLGHRVISDNHIGDWGTQFGMIIYGWKNWGKEEGFRDSSVLELTRLYRTVHLIDEYWTAKDELPKTLAKSRKLEEELSSIKVLPQTTHDAKEVKRLKSQLSQLESRSEELHRAAEGTRARIEEVERLDWFHIVEEQKNIRERYLAETAKLHHGDPENLALWQRFLPPCLQEIEQTYARLHVSFDHTLGESFYEEALPGVVEDLKAKGLAIESQGAMCVFVNGPDEPPFIVQKQDGAFLYATTDLATIQYRMSEWKPDAILYVVDHRQSDHFKQLFATARLWGYTEDKVELQHISFGTVLGDDGKPFKTRSGTNVGLMGLLDEAVERAGKIAAESVVLADATDEERRTVGERIGIGAIKYADLAHNRTSDYKFSYDKMLAMTGNTAAYMQYSYARVRSIFNKAISEFGLRIADWSEESAIRNPQSAIILDSPYERALAVALLQFPEALDRVVADYRPNNLTDYLFDLAGKYSAFFENCPVLKAETDELRTSRLKLCDLTARTLKQGLELLGIETVERM